MSRDTLLRSDDGTVWSLDNLSTQHWLEGKVAGAEEAIGGLYDHAVELFANRKDTEAFAMRKLADELRDSLLPRLRSASKQHETDFPVRPEDAPRSDR